MKYQSRNKESEVDALRHYYFDGDGVDSSSAFVKLDDVLEALAAMEGEAVAWYLIGEDGKPAFAPYFAEADADAMIAEYANLRPEDREVFTKHPLYPAPPSPIDPAAVLALADRLEGIVDACAANGADRIEGMDTAISELRSLATGGQDGR